jgi:lipoprotein-anchoring transpeptidase ErfK/SrfK
MKKIAFALAASASFMVVHSRQAAAIDYAPPSSTGYVVQYAPPVAQRVTYSDRRMGGGLLEALFGDDQTQYPDPRAARARNPQPVDPQQAARQSQPDYEPARPAFDPMYEKQVVDYDGREAPGTLVIDTTQKFLYLVQAKGKALRYGVGVGKPGFAWSGIKRISAKKEWPDWTPPAEMLERRPDLPRHMAGGPENPLGARAMYLGSSLYRIHGSNEPWTIGTAVSSGCIRMRNEDVIDLYGRVTVGTKVVVI